MVKSAPLRLVIFAVLTFLILPFPQTSRADTPMEKSWERLEKAFNKLRDGMKDPKDSQKQIYIKLGVIMREEAEVCLKLDPKMLKNVPAADQPAFLDAYRADMTTFIADIDKLNVALEAGQ